MYQDTIAAISTPIGEGGIGIVRMSGEKARFIAEQLFNQPLNDHRLVYGHIIEPETKEIVDEILVSYMAAPHTYTREDVVEINCHGGIIPLQHILGLTLKHGARLATPGEFTLRAFLNGRIDLTQAESVMDVIQAKTSDSLRMAMEGLKGRLSKQLFSIRDELLPALAFLTAQIDFPEDELAEQDIIGPLQKASEQLQRLIDIADAGIIYRQGIRTAIVGRPNVGKSSLLNLLLRESRAIVTALPGTTRDTIEEVVNLKGVPFILVDTAGITESKDIAESLGVERSRKAIEHASLILLVVDSSEQLTVSDREIFDLLTEKTVIIAAHKSDLTPAADLPKLDWPIVHTCAITGKGLEILEEEMLGIAIGGKIASCDAFMVTNVRHKEALMRAVNHLKEAQQSIDANMPDDFITIDLSEALNAIGEITGQTVNEDLLETIFSQFCIGK